MPRTILSTLIIAVLGVLHAGVLFAGEGGEKPDSRKPQKLHLSAGADGALAVLSEEAFRGGRQGGGNSVELNGLAEILGTAVLDAPEFKPESGTAFDPGALPIRLVLRWNPTIGKCKVYVGQVLCNYDDAGIERAKNKVLQILQTGTMQAEIDAGDDVPSKWVLAALDMLKGTALKQVNFSAKLNDPEFEKIMQLGRSVAPEKKSPTAFADVEVRLILAPEAPFKAMRNLMALCAGAKVVKIFVGLEPEKMIDVSLPVDRGLASAPPNAPPGEMQGPFGIGGTEEGPFSGRFGGKRPLQRHGGGRTTESAVLMGLIWLKNHQNPDGMWSCRKYMMNCKKGTCTGAGSKDEYDMGCTGLSTLAFLGAGHTHAKGKFKNAVLNALKALKKRQTPDGCFGENTPDGTWIYNHALCTQAMSEAHGMSGKSPLFQGPAEKAVQFLLQCRNPDLGWRYGIRTGQNDSSCTAVAVAALKSARMAGLKVPDEAFQGALRWFDQVTDKAYYKTGYLRMGDPGSRLSAAVEKFKPLEALTAAAVVSRIFALDGWGEQREVIRGGGTLLRNRLPVWDEEAGTIDMYYWYWGTLAMFQLGSGYWDRWNPKMKDALVPNQRKEGCECGSWDPVGAWGAAGGRVYSTAINVLTLEAYYRYPKIGK